MGVKDRNIIPTASVARDKDSIEVVTAINLAGVVIHSFVPGYKYRLARVRSFCRTKAGAVSYVVKVGGRIAVAAGVFTAATEVAAVLSATIANLLGSTTEAITVELTTDGTGALVNGRIILEWRAYPMDGEAAAGDT